MNLTNLKKSEIVTRAHFRCKHGHNGLAHPSCYVESTGGPKIGFLDIEASNLKANFGIILSYCIKEENGGIIKNVITPEELANGTFDKRLVKELCRDLREFDRVVTYYGSGFDLPFIRTRAIFHKEDFPVYGEIKHTDLYMIVKKKLNLHSKRLGVACDFFGIAAKEHPLKPDVWLSCLSGNKKALAFVLKHNEEDVISTEDLYHRIKDYGRITDTSI